MLLRYNTTASTTTSNSNKSQLMLLAVSFYHHLTTPLTFVAVSDGKEIYIVVFIVEEEQADPRVNAVDRYDEKYPDDRSLLRRIRVPLQMLIYLKQKRDDHVNIYHHITQFYSHYN